MDQSALMSRADDLSKFGLGYTAPNPIVGCIIVDSNNNVIAEAFHNGGPHAESKAINSIEVVPSDATLFTTLEPCDHYGKTEPCSDLIIKSGIKNVIYSITDPNPIAQGGSKKLRDAGLNVTSGVLTEKVEFTNRHWLQKIKTGRPYFTWKIAMTLDGKIAAADQSSKWITSEQSRDDVARLRSQVDAIITSTGTVLADDPELTSKGIGKDPAIFVVGKREISSNSKLIKRGADLTLIKDYEVNNLITELNKRGFNRVMVEAGPALISSLLKVGVVDEIILYQAPTLLGDGVSFVSPLGINTINDRIDFEVKEVDHKHSTMGRFEDQNRDVIEYLVIAKFSTYE